MSKCNIKCNTDELLDEINAVWRDYKPNYGIFRIEVVKKGLLKCASGIDVDYRLQKMLENLGMITKNYRLSKKGRSWLWIFYNDEIEY